MTARASMIVPALCLVAAALPPSLAGQAPSVTIVRPPSGGIQAQVAVDADGKAHVVYFAGEPAGGDLFYVTLATDGTFSAPRQVNSQPGSAIATGTVRGARLADQSKRNCARDLERLEPRGT